MHKRNSFRWGVVSSLVISILALIMALIFVCDWERLDINSPGKTIISSESTQVDIYNEGKSSAIYTFVATSSTECSVRLSDKSVDKAIIPSSAVIEGKEYIVTSIAGNGFASAANLEKVRLPKTITSIGNAAFANCKNLKSITLNKVESIGTNAFNLCTSLEYLILPNTIEMLAPTILRNCNTQVYIRVSENETQDWATNWNEYNSNQNVEYDSDFTPEVEYTEIYNASTRSATQEVIGYYVADDQPFREEREDDVYVYIPAVYNGQPVVGISDSAFAYNMITYLTVGYADTPIHIDSYAFNGLEGEAVTINREIDINTTDWQGNDTYAEYLFADSTVNKILLPNTIEHIGPYMFNGCINLEDIGFISPTHMESKEEEENICNQYVSTNKVNLPDSLIYIGPESFSGITLLSEIYIPSSVINVGESVFVGWEYPQLISIAYEKENDLPWDPDTNQGWNPYWKNNCSNEVIQFSGEYSIEYVLNGGVNNGNPTTYTSRDRIVFNDAVRTGYTFAGWYLNADFEGENISEISIGSSGDMVLYAKWTPNTYEIVYIANKPADASANVTGTMLNTQHNYDEESKISENVYHLSGWSFIGWNTKDDSTGVEYADGETILNLTNNNGEKIYLYAQWQKNSYTIIYHNNKPNIASGLLSGSMSDSVHYYDTPKALSINQFELLGWTFVGWNTDTLGNGEYFSDGEQIENLSMFDGSTVTLFAQWVQNVYSINYLSNKPSNASNILEGSVSESVHKYDESSRLAMNAYSLEGWTFTGWNTRADGYGIEYQDNNSIINLSAINNDVITLYAQWTPNKYFIEYHGNKPGRASNPLGGTMQNSMFQYDSEEKLSFNQFDLPGWTFIGWNSNEDGTGIKYADQESIFNMTSSNNQIIKLYAQWLENKYVVKYISNVPSNASSNISGMVLPTDAIYEYQVLLAENQFDLPGWQFVEWNTQANGNGTSYGAGETAINLTTELEINLYAQWEPMSYSVSYIANKPETSSQEIFGQMVDSVHYYDTPSKLASNAFLMLGYRFVGWALSSTGSVVYENGDTIEIGASQGESIVLYAVWNIIEYNIWGTNSTTGQRRLYDTYTVEEEKTFKTVVQSGYIHSFSISIIPKGSTGDVEMVYSIEPISYTLVIQYYATGGVQLKADSNYSVKYDEGKTITAPDFSGYDFQHFAQLKEGVTLPPLLPGEDPDIGDIMNIYQDKTTTFKNLTDTPNAEIIVRAVYKKEATIEPSEPSCITTGTLITLSDGTQIPVEQLNGTEELLVWNLMTGQFDSAPILFIDSEDEKINEVVTLYFSDGTKVEIIDEHGFWNFDLNKYVFLRNDAAKYIGHWFNKQIVGDSGQFVYTKVQLVNVEVVTKYTQAWSPVTYSHLCYYVNGMLSMPGATEGLINIFDVNSETMKIDVISMQQDIDQYGLYTYQEFVTEFSIPEEIYEAFNGQYMKIALGKGLITKDMLSALIARYQKFFV